MTNILREDTNHKTPICLELLLIDGAEEGEVRIAFCSIDESDSNQRALPSLTSLSKLSKSIEELNTERSQQRTNASLKHLDALSDSTPGEDCSSDHDDTFDPFSEKLRASWTRNIKLKNASFSFESETRAISRVGNIYVGIVANVVPSLNAVFINYGQEKSGFLPINAIHPAYYNISEIEKKNIIDALVAQRGSIGIAEVVGSAQYEISKLMKVGQRVIVQVVKEEKGNKGVTLTTFLSLSSQYLILLPNSFRPPSISKKISDPMEVERLLGIVQTIKTNKEIQKICNELSIIIRSNAEYRTTSEILADFEALMEEWMTIERKNLSKDTITGIVHKKRSTDIRAKNDAASSDQMTDDSRKEERVEDKDIITHDAKMLDNCLYEESSIIKRVLQEITSSNVDYIVVSGQTTYNKCKKTAKRFSSHLARKIVLYNDIKPIFTYFNIEEEIIKAHLPKVPLPSGGYLVINQTEALTVVDVNSGRATMTTGIEDTAFRTNLEAVDVLCQQIKIRNVAGLIVVDFIDMARQENIDVVHRKLKTKTASTDEQKVSVSEFSQFGIVQMTRKRDGYGLAEMVTRPCDQCHGSGVVRIPEATVNAIMRAIHNEIAEMDCNKYNTLTVACSAEIALRILNTKRDELQAILKHIGVQVNISIDAESGYDGFFIEYSFMTRYSEHDYEQESICWKAKDNIESNSLPNGAIKLGVEIESDEANVSSDKKERHPTTEKWSKNGYRSDIVKDKNGNTESQKNRSSHASNNGVNVNSRTTRNKKVEASFLPGSIVSYIIRLFSKN